MLAKFVPFTKGQHTATLEILGSHRLTAALKLRQISFYCLISSKKKGRRTKVASVQIGV